MNANTPNKYNEKVMTLAQLRLLAEGAKTAYNSFMDRIQQSPQYQKRVEEKQRYAAEVADIETEIRNLITEDANNGEKPDHPALGVRQKTVVDIDDAQVISWLIEKGFREFLSVDRKSFDKLATSMIENGAQIPGVSISKVPQPTIKTDLTPWL